MDLTTPYKEILKTTLLEPQREVICIRTGSLEPVFDNYVRYYDPHIVVRYTDIYGYLQEESSAPAVAILTLREIAPTLWEHLYTLKEEERETHIGNVRHLISQLISKMEACSKQPVFFLLYEESSAFSAANATSAADIAAEVNTYVLSIVRSTQVIRTAEVAGKVGISSFWDHRKLYRFGCPYSQAGCNALAYYTVQALDLPAPKKCIVCDCDGVLWGGILADDGFEGIELSGEFGGRAYRDFQRELTRLVDEGIILCLCSKNEEPVVREVLNNHPDMIVREQHISAMRVGWDNKADSIRSLAQELNISVADIVFIDDSVYEIGLVQSELPEVLCIQLDADRPADYASILREQMCFPKAIVTDEDRIRTKQYQCAVKRNLTFETSTNLEQYHAGLQTNLTIRPATTFDLPRITQLAMRTNQCNLSGGHPDLAEVQRIFEDSGQMLLCMYASDVYGDMGLVGAAVLSHAARHAVITHFWLSCRVFNRGFEDAMLSELCKVSADAGCIDLQGVYIPTGKNQKFADFYERHGVSIYEL